MARKAISKRLRFEVFKRDGFTCQYCGAHPPGATLHVDHIIAVACGGTNDINNLVTACDNCNLGKSDVPLDAVPQSLEERAAEVAEREAQIAGYSAVMEARRQRIDDDCWRVAEILTPGASDGYSRKRFQSIKMFVERLGVHDVLDAAEMAAARVPHDPEAFRYFCGICWNWVRDGRDG